MIQQILKGIASYLTALDHLSKYRMWSYVVIPGILSIVIGGLIGWSAWNLSDDIGARMVDLWAWEWGRGVVDKVARVFGGLLVLAVGLIFLKQILMVLLAPLMSILSEKVESQIRGNPSDRPFTIQQILRDLMRGLRIAIRNLIRELAGTAILFLLGLIPVFTPFTTVLIFLLQAYYAGFGNMDYTLERHLGYRESIRFVGKNRGLAIGNGVVFLLLFFTFIGFLVALPLGTVAATIQTVKSLDVAEEEFL